MKNNILGIGKNLFVIKEQSEERIYALRVNTTGTGFEKRWLYYLRDAGYWVALTRDGYDGSLYPNKKRFIVDDCLKTLFFFVPKNGCTSILGNTLINKGFDFSCNPWLHPNKEDVIRYHPQYNTTKDAYKDYRKVFVYTNEEERFIRYLNYNKRVRNIGIVDYGENYVQHFLNAYPFLTHEGEINDEHLMPQKYYLEVALEYSNEIEYVPLKDLHSWYEDTFGRTFKKFNVSHENQKKITFDSLTKEQ